MILVIDNYDSFTYNLVQYIGELEFEINIVRNDEMNIGQLASLKPEAIIISPGPGSPRDSGLSLDILNSFSGYIPILGICLGHQSIGHLLGAQIIHAPTPVHGKTSLIYHDGKDLFSSIDNPFKATRYHSLIISHSNIPEDLIINAWTDTGIIMGCKHKEYPNLYGIQFHPESLWTKEGRIILKNFLNIVR